MFSLFQSAPGVLDGVISQHAPAGAVNVQLLRCERPRCSARPLFSRRAAQPAGGAEEGSSDSGVVRLLLCRKHTPKAALQAPSLSCRTASAPSSPVLSPASSWATRSCASGQGSSGAENVLSPGLEGRAAALTIEVAHPDLAALITPGKQVQPGCKCAVSYTECARVHAG
jgi:hypothetical protein